MGMSRRVFERSFKKYLGMSPATYFKQIKLMQIRRDVIHERGDSISHILQKYNIGHAGHFGQYYKSIFNETLGNTRRSSF